MEDTLAAVVRRLRVARGWSVEDLSHYSRVPGGTILEIEKGRTKDPRASTLKDLADTLEVPITHLPLPSRRRLAPEVTASSTTPERRIKALLLEELTAA